MDPLDGWAESATPALCMARSVMGWLARRLSVSCSTQPASHDGDEREGTKERRGKGRMRERWRWVGWDLALTSTVASLQQNESVPVAQQGARRRGCHCSIRAASIKLATLYRS